MGVEFSLPYLCVVCTTLFKSPHSLVFLKVFQGFKIVFVNLNFSEIKPSKGVLNQVFNIGILGIVLYLTLNLFRSIQVRSFSFSLFHQRDKRVSKSWETLDMVVTRVSGQTKLRGVCNEGLGVDQVTCVTESRVLQL